MRKRVLRITSERVPSSKKKKKIGIITRSSHLDARINRETSTYALAEVFHKTKKQKTPSPAIFIVFAPSAPISLRFRIMPQSSLHSLSRSSIIVISPPSLQRAE